MKTITLLTDFGTKDPYAGIMKGVILSICPDVRIVDITHEVDPQDVREGAFLIEEYYRYFEKGTIHVAVVDPTVGSDRRPIISFGDGYFFVGPDNGLFTLIYNDSPTIFAIENKRYMAEKLSSTFHGRDIFAPAAAHLASGVDLSAFGSPVGNPVYLSGIHPVIETRSIRGEVVRFDRFGNAVSNITEPLLERVANNKSFSVGLHGMSFRTIQKTYCEGQVTCLINSAGYLEFGSLNGNLREKLGLHKGDAVVVKVS